MDLLEYYHNQRPNNEHFVIRKLQLPLLPYTHHINLYGVRGSGKTSLVLDTLTQIQNEPILYIDMQDPKLLFHTWQPLTLQQYIDTHNISVLVLDHYEESLLPHFPKVANIIVLTRIALAQKDITSTKSFLSLELFPLDYEEFLAFDASAAQNKGFNHFLRSGTLPLLAHSQKTSTQAMKLFFQSAFLPQEQKLLLLLARYHTQHLSVHQIYTFAKERFKVSKDWLYKTIRLFEQEKLITFIEDYQQKSAKKMILFDFAFAKYLTLGQPFILQFDSMIALALIKHNIPIQTLGIHGYITQKNTLIIPAPFESEESLWLKSQKKISLYKHHGISKIIIITVANSYHYQIEKLHFEALPFDEWSVINTEEE